MWWAHSRGGGGRQSEIHLLKKLAGRRELGAGRFLALLLAGWPAAGRAAGRLLGGLRRRRPARWLRADGSIGQLMTVCVCSHMLEPHVQWIAPV